MSILGNAMARNMKSRPGRNPYELLLVQSAWNLQKNDSYAFNSEQNLFSTSSQWPLAYVLLLLAIFWCHLVNFPGEKSILPYFSSPRGVATLDCEFHSQAGSTTLLSHWYQILSSQKEKMRSVHPVVAPRWQMRLYLRDIKVLAATDHPTINISRNLS